MLRTLEDGLPWRPWIGGAEVDATDREVDRRTSPIDGRVLADVEQAGEDDLSRAVDLAHRTWRHHGKTPGHVRAGWLRAAADALDDNRDVLVETIVRAIGKPAAASRVEVNRGSQLLRLAAEEIVRFGGENLVLDGVPGGEERWGVTRREPIGVVAAVTPFNAPVNLFLQKVAPALAVGNAVVAKPAPEVAVVAIQLAQILGTAVPRGLVAVVPGGKQTALALAAHRRVDAVSLTGGVDAGAAVRAAAGIKPVLLELGSNAATIVCADADLESAASRTASAAFAASGQQCISTQRIIVESAAFDDFLERFVSAAAALRVGDPAEETTDIGTLVHAGRREAIERFIDDAVARDGRLALDGRAEDLRFGPTVVVDPPRDALIWTEEVFGPVAAVVNAPSLDAAIELANDSRYGLQSACFTRDIGTALRVAEELRSGSVWINESTRFRLDTYPFGGYGESGIGREGVRYAMEALSHVKFVGIRRG